MTPDIEEVRAYWSFLPCNVRHSPAPVGSPEWSREVTRRKYFVERHIRGFAQFHRWYKKRVLEIGCGIGTDTLEFLREGAQVDAVDLSGESIVLAEQRCRRFSWGKFYTCNAEEWLPAGLYDLVYSFGVLHHTPNPEKVLAQVACRLRPGSGEFRFMVYARWSWKRLMGYQPEAQAGCPLVRWYTGREIREMLRPYGFKVVEIRKAHIFPWKVKEYREYRYVMEWWWRWMPEWLFRLLERFMGHHLLVVARLK